MLRLAYLRDQLARSKALDELYIELINSAQEDLTPHGQRNLVGLYKAQEMCAQQTLLTLQALSPVLWIPNEVLVEIFLHSLPEDYRFSRKLAPLVLCWVCQSWRHLVFSNPKLWKRLSFWAPPTCRRDRLCYPTRLVNRWLSHSQTLPLRLFFEPGMTRNHLKTFVELVLLEYYAQCQHLELSVSTLSARGLINFINLPPGSLCSLESLVLDGFDEVPFSSAEDDDEDEIDDENTSIPIPITVFTSSPKLRKLATSSLNFIYHVDVDKLQFNMDILPWGGLTHLLITDFINIDVFVRALAECLALRFLRVSLSLLVENEEPNHVANPDLPIRVVLQDLTAMYVTVDGGSSFPPAMDIFQLPALTDLHFRRCCEATDRFSWDESVHFCSQLGLLRHLKLTGHVGSTQQVISFLRRTSTVTTLFMNIVVDYTTLIPVLFPAETVPPLPYLTNLELHLESRELCYPQVPASDIFEVTNGSTTFRRMRNIDVDTLQPCIFRLREAIELTQRSSLRDINLFYLRGPLCEKSLREVRRQFHSSVLATHFEKNNVSKRGGSDRVLMDAQCASTSYTIS